MAGKWWILNLNWDHRTPFWNSCYSPFQDGFTGWVFSWNWSDSGIHGNHILEGNHMNVLFGGEYRIILFVFSSLSYFHSQKWCEILMFYLTLFIIWESGNNTFLDWLFELKISRFGGGREGLGRRRNNHSYKFRILI